MAISMLPCLLLLVSAILFAGFAEGGSVGVNYGRDADNLPPPLEVVRLLQSQGINKVKIYYSDPELLTALSNSGITVTSAVPNTLLSSAASGQSFADNWVETNIARFYPAIKFDAIAVGNEVFRQPGSLTQFLVPAMRNIHAALVRRNLHSAIKISTPIAFDALQYSFPPSAGSFKPDLIEPALKPILDFLRQTGSYFMVNVYPFFAYRYNSGQISLDYALGRDNPGVVDTKTGLKYFSLFVAEVDALYAAMSAIGYGDIKIVVSETGWPSAGDSHEIGASKDNAAAYNGNLIRRVLTGPGTPSRQGDPLKVLIFALFNENKKQGPTSERNFGLFYPNKQRVYDIPAISSIKTQIPATQSWCVATRDARPENLQAALDYACGEGGADCSPIQIGATCYEPNTLEAHASYAFNSYYQKNSRAPGTCDFGGTAYIVTQPPQFGGCELPA